MPTDTQEPTDEPDPTDDPGLVIGSSNDEASYNCDGLDVLLTGNNNRLTLGGICSSLTITGNHNHIILDAPTPIDDRGNQNTIEIR